MIYTKNYFDLSSFNYSYAKLIILFSINNVEAISHPAGFEMTKNNIVKLSSER